MEVIGLIGDLYLFAMESTDKPRGSDGFWCVERIYHIFDENKEQTSGP